MKKISLVLALLALGAFSLAACGDDDEETTSAATTSEETTSEDAATGGGGGSVAIEADPGGALAYTQDEVTAPAGSVTIEFDNPASIGHDVVVEDADGNELARTDVISESTATATGDFEPGEYTFYCSVSGHRDAGMEGAFIVE